MRKSLSIFLDKLDTIDIKPLNIIEWGAPIPSFGSLSKSRLATLGLNPSNREFVDYRGEKLPEIQSRFHTLSSLELKRWSEIKDRQIEDIICSCEGYFKNRPYDKWFRVLDGLISGTETSYYEDSACHLDLIPYATFEKWSHLTKLQQESLLEISRSGFIALLEESKIEFLILNGKSVISTFEKLLEVKLEEAQIMNWKLPRKNGKHVQGYSYKGSIRLVGNSSFQRTIKVVGYNHNIQSSFGVTRKVKESIKNWISDQYCLMY